LLNLAPLASAPAGASASYSHVFEVVMENFSYSQAMATPQFATLARRYAYASNYYGVSHPSLPNYLALSGGSTFATTSDCTTCYVSAPNLFSQLAAARVSYGAYLEGAPGACFLDPYGGSDYASKHNPWRYYDNVRSSPTMCAHLHPYGDLAPLLAGPASRVPRYVWVTPSLCHDGHDCAPSVAGNWLTSFVAQVTRSAAWQQGGVLYVTWDEADGDNAGVVGSSVRAFGGGGRVLTLVITPGVTHVVLRATLNHYSLLATIEDNFHLARLGFARGAGAVRVPGKS
jgi:phosphatidylinositol-3-phosphatase